MNITGTASTNSALAPMSSRVLAAIHHFLPALAVPPSANNLTNVVSVFIFAACLSLTYKGPTPAYLRLALFVLVVSIGHPLLTKDYAVPRRTISPIITSGGAMLLFKALDVCVVSLWDPEPPHWVKAGKRVPLPNTFWGRLVYAFDLVRRQLTEVGVT
ncbi:hypothetical protein DL93DRAFT_1996290 [Clavulina sp. PMI_390]|nr:hypothetical protein DL93DRAFT_1996290 [Clavulina sp. PMI_390]